MNLNKIIYSFVIFFLVSNPIFADNHNLDLNKNNTNPIPTVSVQVDKKKSIEEELNDVPLNNPFGGGVGTSESFNAQNNLNITSGISALQSVKLVGIIKGRSKQYALFQNPNGSIQILEKQDYVTGNLSIFEIQSEIVVIQDSDKKFYEVAFNNSVRPSEGSNK